MLAGEDVKRRLRGDRVAQAQDEYANDPQPSGLTYGPRTPARFLRDLARQTGPA